MKFVEQNIVDLSLRYPQLRLPIERGISHSEIYKNVVLRGKQSNHLRQSFVNNSVQIANGKTPAGDAEIVFVSNRDDFVHMYQALAYRCEPEEIPDSVGATTISGIINWRKINEHKFIYLSAGNTNWNEEFKRFTSIRSNYVDTLVLISSGPYSAVPACHVCVSENEWRNYSIIIRTYHELTHFVCRKLFPPKKDTIRDEIYADCIGLISAFGTYNPMLARLFLGIDSDNYRNGARLEHYVTGCIDDAISKANQWIQEAENNVAREWSLCENWENLSEEERNKAVFDLLLRIY